MFQVSRRSITLVLCLGKLKSVRDTADTYSGRYSPRNKLLVGAIAIGKKYIFAHTTLPPTPTKKSTRIYSLGWAGIKLILSL